MEWFSKKRTAMIQISICREFQCSLLKDAVVRAQHPDGHDWKWPQLWSTRCTTSTAHFPPSESATSAIRLHKGPSLALRQWPALPRPADATSTSTDVTSLFRAPTCLRNKRKPSIQWGGPYPNNTRRSTTSQLARYVTSVLGLTGERKDANILRSLVVKIMSWAYLFL